jgi:hypothetical protein
MKTLPLLPLGAFALIFERIRSARKNYRQGGEPHSRIDGEQWGYLSRLRAFVQLAPGR